MIPFYCKVTNSHDPVDTQLFVSEKREERPHTAVCECFSIYTLRFKISTYHLRYQAESQACLLRKREKKVYFKTLCTKEK